MTHFHWHWLLIIFCYLVALLIGWIVLGVIVIGIGEYRGYKFMTNLHKGLLKEMEDQNSEITLAFQRLVSFSPKVIDNSMTFKRQLTAELMAMPNIPRDIRIEIAVQNVRISMVEKDMEQINRRLQIMRLDNTHLPR